MQPNDTAPTQRKRAPHQPPVARICEVCAAPFVVDASSVSRGRGRFCGRPCFFEHQRTTVERACEQCGGPFRVKPSMIAKGAGRFCSVSCHDGWQRSAQPVGERLWLRVDKHGPTPPHRAEYGNCWVWTGKRMPSGYGSIYRHFPDAVLTHRLAWEVATGETLTSDDVIGHVCDIRHCVRNGPEGTYPVRGIALPRWGHLFKGTQEDNRLDMVEKGRHRFVLGQYVKRGEENPRACLTDESIHLIRTLYAQGDITQTALSARFAVSQPTIFRIILHKGWKHID